MSTLYIHIGTMKTGTTSIQGFLAKNKEEIEKHGYCFPTINKEHSKKYRHRNGHFLIYRSNCETEEEREKEEQEYFNYGFNIIEHKFQKFENVIISDEILWYRQKKNNFWEDVKAETERIGCDFKVIVYLRRQDLFVQSFWKQTIKGGPLNTETFDEYIDNKHYSFCCLDYYKMLNYMVNHIGQDRIIVRVYENGQFEGTNNTLISDFLHNIGLELTDEYQMPDIYNNTGVGGNYTEIKRLINMVTGYKETDNFLYKATQCASEMQYDNAPDDSEFSLFGYEKQCEFLKSYEKGNRKIAKQFLNRQDGILFRQEVKKLPKWEFNEDKIYRDIIFVFTAAIMAQRNELLKKNEEIKELKETIKNQKQEIDGKIKTLDLKLTSVYNSLIFRTYRKIRNFIK